uniref:Cytochrome P450 n=1 Tax=Homarus americanus TaxID=6706 RepID=O76345_HOMAM|nr:cytochrome P450 [Homarus americanus]
MITVVLVAVLAVLLTHFLWRRKNHFQLLARNGIPTPKYHWLLGHMEQTFYSPGKRSVVEVKHEWLQLYGKVCGFYSGAIPRVLVADLDMLKHILVKDINNFVNRSFFGTDKKMLIFLRDQQWKDVRRIMTPVFSSAKMKKMMPLMGGCVEELMDMYETAADSGQPIDMMEAFQCLTMDVINRCAITLDINCIKNPKNEVLAFMRKYVSQPIPCIFKFIVAFPMLYDLIRLLIPENKRNNITFIEEHLTKVVKQRREQTQATVVDGLQLLVDAADANVDASKTKLTDEEVVDNAFLFLLAGFETTSTALTYTSYLLALNPDIQEKIFQEVEEVVGLERAPSYEDLSKLVYTEAVALESTRMYPPVTGFITRQATQDWQYGPYTIPAGTEVEVPVWSIHHNPELYPQPELFKPERFLPKAKKDRHTMAYLGFGGGPRNCLGLRFALMEMKLVLSSVIQRFYIKPCSHTKVPLTLVTRNVFTNPDEGVWLTLHRRTTDLPHHYEPPTQVLYNRLCQVPLTK